MGKILIKPNHKAMEIDLIEFQFESKEQFHEIIDKMILDGVREAINTLEQSVTADFPWAALYNDVDPKEQNDGYYDKLPTDPTTIYANLSFKDSDDYIVFGFSIAEAVADLIDGNISKDGKIHLDDGSYPTGLLKIRDCLEKLVKSIDEKIIGSSPFHEPKKP